MDGKIAFSFPMWNIYRIALKSSFGALWIIRSHSVPFTGLCFIVPLPGISVGLNRALGITTFVFHFCSSSIPRYFLESRDELHL